MAASEPFSFPTPQQEKETEEATHHQQLLLSLPKHKGWVTPHAFQYQNFWYNPKHLLGVLTCQTHFKALDSDIVLVTAPKSGTTWLKALLFTLLNRHRHPVNALHRHPLTSHNPHDLVPFLEYKHNPRDLIAMPSPRLFATHIPILSLPSSVRDSDAKIVYLCRDPRDTLISHWHFSNKLRDPEDGAVPLEEAFEGFCEGVSSCGPFWDHILGYWKASLEMPSRVMFLKYEDVKGDPGSCLRRLAGFLGCGFSVEEEEEGVVERIVGVCSFDCLRSLEVNSNGKQVHSGVENKAFFRRGEVGDWKNYLTLDMSERLRKIVEEKMRGSGLSLIY